MKLQLASDLHLESLAADGACERIVVPAADADALVLAGDVHRGLAAVDAFGDWPVPVLYVAGNHEFYGRSWERTRDDLRRACAGTRITFLDDDVARFDGVRILGCTLWTDFELAGRTRAEWMHDVDRELDAHGVGTVDGPLRSRQLLADHRRSRRWLEAELATAFDGVTVVVSHHAPHPGSLQPRYAGHRLNAAFASDLTPLFDSVDLWLHGHVHDSADHRVGRCRIVANPAGNARGALTRGGLEVENRAFDRCLIVVAEAATTVSVP